MGKRKKALQLESGFGALWGIVTNSEDSTLIEDAEVYIVELGIKVSTDEEGIFYFEKVPVGKYTLKVIAETYLEEIVSDVEILPYGELNIDIALNSDDSNPPA